MILNGRECSWSGVTISWEEIAWLTRESQPSVTYRFTDSGAKGILYPGDRIAVSGDLVINAYATGNA